MTLGEILRSLIADIDLTQKELAKNIRVAASTLGNYIQDIREPDFATLIKLADYFGVTTDYLLDHRAGYAINHCEDELLRVFRSLTLDQQSLFLDIGKLLVMQNYSKEK